MDLRIEKTRCAIRNAFLQLRVRKPLEKITVKELAALANINKATFYLHYRDIYDLSETLEKDVVNDCMKGITHPKDVFTDTRTFIRDMKETFHANEQLIKILFEGSRSVSFINMFEDELYKVILSAYPDYQPSLENRMMMTYIINGGYYTYFKYCDNGITPVFDIIEVFSDGVMKMHKKTEDENNK